MLSASQERSLAPSQHIRRKPSKGRTHVDHRVPGNTISTRASLRTCASLQTFTLLVILCVFSFLRSADAAIINQHNHGAELLFDRATPPLPNFNQMDIVERATAVRRSASGSAILHAAAASQSSTVSTKSLPRPFDSNLGNNFTSSTCPTFFETFLNDPDFQKCLPLSLLLQTSNAFFAETRSIPELSHTLSATCAVDFPQCNQLMTSYATQIQQSTACGSDLQKQNPMVVEAYNGFKAYAPLYHAGCLRNPTTNEFCYAEAVSNTTAPGSSYIYYLPLGVELPTLVQTTTSMQPSCNGCLRQTMQIFSGYSEDAGQALSTDYEGAAEVVNNVCGGTFVDSAVKSVSKTSGAVIVGGRSKTVVAGAMMVGTWIALA